MALLPGTRIGPYEIGAPIGAGGMGEVYRARDPRLQRDVAVKVIPPTFSAGTDGADYPFWSPDSRSVGFFAGGKLRKIEASGGPAQTLSDAPIPRRGAWSRDGVIVFAPTATGPLHRVAAAGGTSTPLTALDASNGEISHRTPSFLPDGRRFLFMVQGAEDKQGIHVGSLDAEGHTLLLKATSSGAYAAPGYLLFVRERALMAQRCDAETLALTGDACRG